MLGHRPPAARMGRYVPSATTPAPTASQLAVGRRPPLPLSQMKRPQSAVEPLIHVREDAGRGGEVKVHPPPLEIAPEFRDDRAETPPTGPACDSPDALLHPPEAGGRDAGGDHSAPGYPKAVAEELPGPHSRHRTLGGVNAAAPPRAQAPPG